MKKILWRVGIWLRNTFIILFVMSLFFVILYKYVPVYYTPLMFIRGYEQLREDRPFSIQHEWVPINEISQQLVQAVVASEDNLFLLHNGFDFDQIEIAQRDAEKGKKLRGASTISQQTAKNVFLWPGKSYIRKGLEAYFTVLIEFVWGKERIMEVYLNSIEMGDGIYGAEAVAQLHFNKPAAELNTREAALIAVSLPNPRKMNSAHPSAYMLKRQEKIVSLMGKIIQVNFGRKPQDNKDKPLVRPRKKWRG